MGGETTDEERDGGNTCKKPPARKKRHTHYNPEWVKLKDFEWIRPTEGDNFSATCFWCPAKISVKYEGRNALEIHAKTKKHQVILLNKQKQAAITTFMTRKGSPEEDKIAVAELTSIYHGVKHGHSYLSTDCGNKGSAKIFNDSTIASKMSCGRTKSEALVQNVLAPYTQEQLATQLQVAPYFSVCSDASNSGNSKLYTYTVQYFHVEEGIKYGLLEFYEDPHETSSAIYEKIVNITEENGLCLSQVSAYGADNASVNFGKLNSVFQKLKEVNPHIMKGNCKCHLIHNSLKNANRIFSAAGYDAEAIVLKIYSEFSCSAKRADSLKDFCEFTSVQYKKILRHVPTRWLSLLPAIQRILECWPALKCYFLSLGKEDCPDIIWRVMCKRSADAAAESSDEDEVTVSECVLLFLHNVMQEFHCAILKLENESATLLDIHEVMSRLRSQLILRRADRFNGQKTKQATRKLSATEQSKFATLADSFFEKAVLYLEANFDFDDPVLSQTSCLGLSGPIKWDAIEGLVNKLALDIDEDKLYQDYTILNSVFEFIREDLAPDKKWAFFFKKENTATELLKVVSFIFSVPVSNVYAERVFSHMEDGGSDKRHRMSVGLVKAELQVRLNFKVSCLEFKALIEGQHGVLKAGKGDAKYTWKNR